MKNFLSIGMFLFLIFGVCGCGKEKVTKTCSLKTITDDYTISANYTVTSLDGYVQTVTSKEVLTSDDSEFLSNYKTKMMEYEETYGTIDYYDMEVTYSGNTVTDVIRIDYANMDTDELLEIDPTFSSIIKDGKLALDDLLAIYTVAGITCE